MFKVSPHSPGTFLGEVNDVGKLRFEEDYWRKNPIQFAVQLDDAWLAEAADEVETMAAVWQQCADAGIWPGPAEMMADAGKLTLTRPRYAQAYTVGE